VSGPEFLRYGGHTSCVALARDGEPPSLILDAGTGLRRYGALFPDQPFRGALLLGHLHLDHTQGLGFFAGAEGGKVDLYLPAQGDPVEVLSRVIGPPFFPLTPGELRGEWTFSSLEAGTHRIQGWSVLALDIPHGGGRTFGYRISDGSASVAYVCDHGPIELGDGPDGLGEYHPTALELATGVDLLIHDAQHRANEFPALAFMGHSAAEYACGLATKAGAERLALFHHDPDRTDDQIDSLVADVGTPCLDVFAAADGQSLDVRGLDSSGPASGAGGSRAERTSPARTRTAAPWS
jgi:ribonuclease BN (tRNA processing enzyme)